MIKPVEQNSESVHDNFRLYLSSKPTPTFPVGILQNSLKVVDEPSVGVRAQVRQSLADMDRGFFEHNCLGLEWRQLVFGLSFFHALIRERKKFQHLGWNTPFEFSDTDFNCCCKQLEILCGRERVDWKGVECMIRQIIYGGKIANEWDQRCMNSVLKPFLSKSPKFSSSDTYNAPAHSSIKAYMSYVENLPIVDESEIFGLHSNATIAVQCQEASKFLKSLFSLQTQKIEHAYHIARDNDKSVLQIIEDLEMQLPINLKQSATNNFHLCQDSTGRKSALTSFMQLEINRFNILLDEIRRTLNEVKKAVMGLTFIPSDLETAQFSLLNNQVKSLGYKFNFGNELKYD